MRARVGPREQAFELAVEYNRVAQKAVTQLLELVLLEQKVLTDIAVEAPDRLGGEIKPLPLALVGCLQVSISPGHPGVGDRQLYTSGGHK